MDRHWEKIIYRALSAMFQAKQQRQEIHIVVYMMMTGIQSSNGIRKTHMYMNSVLKKVVPTA